MAQVEEKVDDLRPFCQYLAGKPHVAVEDLPKPLQAQAVLAKAVSKGYAEIGRRSYSEIIVSMTPKKEKNGHPMMDENFRQVVTKEIKAVPDNEWSWTNLSGQNHKPLAEVLAEDAKLPDEVKLHVRLTTAGLAASL